MSGVHDKNIPAFGEPAEIGIIEQGTFICWNRCVLRSSVLIELMHIGNKDPLELLSDLRRAESCDFYSPHVGGVVCNDPSPIGQMLKFDKGMIGVFCCVLSCKE